ncbi:unnamed protein product [Symbiodinium sp. CCMP2456]|nr:unnamed protein product [Symbiodinium sp. CCMP2456]
MLVFFVVFFFGQHLVHCIRPVSLWVDRACVHQTDHELKRRQIRALPVFVAQSSSMLVLWDDEYFQRLWCQLELATFAKHGSAQKVHFLPLWRAPWLLSGLLLDTLVVTGVNILNYRIPQEVLTSPTTFSAILPRRLLESGFGPLVTLAVFFVLLGTALGILVSIPWTMACRAKLRSHALMLEQMACFDCRAAECTVEADRILVEQQVQNLFRSVLGEREVMVLPTTSTGTEDSVAYTQTDDEALDAFNSYIRGPLRTAVMESVGDQLHVPYNMCLVASLPMIFYSATDILQCDATCMSNMGYSSFGNYLLPILLSWLSTIVLVVPIFYPVFLRMLKCAFSVQSELLQLLLAALSGILTVSYGFLCAAPLFGLLAVSNQEGSVAVLPLLVILVFLLMQLRCLFGTDRDARGSPVDTTYRALHAADDFSI